MQFQNNPFAALQQMGGMPDLAGAGGFAGPMGQGGLLPMPGMGGAPGGMFGSKPNWGAALGAGLSSLGQSMGGNQGGGFNPMMLSPLLYALHKNPSVGLGMISPAAGLAHAFGAFK